MGPLNALVSNELQSEVAGIIIGMIDRDLPMQRRHLVTCGISRLNKITSATALTIVVRFVHVAIQQCHSKPFVG